MFEEARLLGTNRNDNCIVVQTRTGRNLDNWVGPAAGYSCHGKFRALCKAKGLNWHVRKQPTGGYNCAGLVWASRRTVLYNPDNWEQILADDGYRLVVVGEEAELGDIVIYRKKNDDEILHVASVCRIDRLTVTADVATTPILRALSKWDLTSGEVVHGINDVFLNGGEDFETFIYTDRPLQ